MNSIPYSFINFDRMSSLNFGKNNIKHDVPITSSNMKSKERKKKKERNVGRTNYPLG